jgi:hypothetical protein
MGDLKPRAAKGGNQALKNIAIWAVELPRGWARDQLARGRSVHGLPRVRPDRRELQAGQLYRFNKENNAAIIVLSRGEFAAARTAFERWTYDGPAMILSTMWRGPRCDLKQGVEAAVGLDLQLPTFLASNDLDRA